MSVFYLLFTAIYACHFKQEQIFLIKIVARFCNDRITNLWKFFMQSFLIHALH